VVERNPAVVRCAVAYARAYKEGKAQGKNDSVSRMDGSAAYRDTFPPLCGHQNITDFIACVAHAMLMGVLRDDQAARLLYAAQVASNATRVPSPKKQASEK
jgi:hypothetical protein